MGNLGSSRRASRCTSLSTPDGPVDFSSFSILRSIGRGSYGKVCIAQKMDTKQLYAMKYMNKAQCIKAGVVTNILQELRLLRLINHTNIVNLRFAFHDIEDMCLVVDLLQGGDLRYHLGRIERFSEHDVCIYLLQVSSALEYLQGIKVIHRDIKPDNLLLNLEGNVHLTDFNVATKLGPSGLAHNESGTWQYMAPEIFSTSTKKCSGYTYSVDWWSLAVTCYELTHGTRPFSVPKTASSASAFYDSKPNNSLRFSSSLSSKFTNVISEMLDLDAENRSSSHGEISSKLNITTSSIDDPKPNFLPSMKKLNVDPAYELEEMIIESKPIHKKHARLSKTASMDSAAMKARISGNNGAILAVIDREFEPFNYLRPSRSHSVPNITLNAVSLDSARIIDKQ